MAFRPRAERFFYGKMVSRSFVKEVSSVQRKFKVMVATFLLVTGFGTLSTSVPAYAANKQTIKLVAVGDSLTEGVGDTTKQQGYTKRTAKLLADKYDVKVKTANYGKAGDRSDQILKRVKKNKQAVSDIKSADVLVMTVGGNDLQQTLFKAIFAKSERSVTDKVTAGMPDYTENLTTLINYLEKKNPDAPIFLFGNYNPLYVYLANRSDLNEDVKIYNGINANLASADDRVYYVSTFNTLTFGQYQTSAARKKLVTEAEKANRGSLDNEMVTDTLNGKSDKELNDYITTLDHYHPNDKGYDKMSALLVKRMAKHTEDWLEK